MLEGEASELDPRKIWHEPCSSLSMPSSKLHPSLALFLTFPLAGHASRMRQTLSADSQSPAPPLLVHDHLSIKSTSSYGSRAAADRRCHRGKSQVTSTNPGRSRLGTDGPVSGLFRLCSALSPLSPTGSVLGKRGPRLEKYFSRKRVQDSRQNGPRHNSCLG